MTLEELLNKLIGKGRVPFGDKRITNVNWQMQYVWTYNWVFWSNHNAVQFWKSTRELVSIESWIWQFCIENWMVKKNTMYYSYWNTRTRREFIYKYDDVVFWMLESSMTNEDNLGQFLLDNIKIDE